jgi:hypothetical protein
MEELPACACASPPFHYLAFENRDLGVDAFGAEICLQQCKTCGSHWLVYLVEWPHYSKSGHWWRAPIPAPLAAGITVETARPYIESLEWCYVGGSYYDQGIHKVYVPIHVF